eukprot:TRINITY_DN2423_c0_g1_i1.p3 TRINITY_DN2423_c0_g1~~TRINITY_DN2423_c0_g1_i1.p3  ORF type:complete len:150 (+),score=4.22 TRINITY_DN2423_c0_g1_i1:1820-2269(+)
MDSTATDLAPRTIQLRNMYWQRPCHSATARSYSGTAISRSNDPHMTVASCSLLRFACSCDRACSLLSKSRCSRLSNGSLRPSTHRDAAVSSSESAVQTLCWTTSVAAFFRPKPASFPPPIRTSSLPLRQVPSSFSCPSQILSIRNDFSL